MAIGFGIVLLVLALALAIGAVWLAYPLRRQVTQLSGDVNALQVALDQLRAEVADLRAAAEVVRGRRVKSGVRALVVPGSSAVKIDAEREGLDRVFRAAGFEWRDSGCSMCNGSNGELVAPGERCASTTNRNFEGRQGRGALTHIMSPAMVAAAAVAGRITDVRRLARR